MSWNHPINHLWWPNMNTLHVFNLTSPIRSTAARSSSLAMKTQAGNQFALELPFGVQIQCVANRFVGNRLIRINWMHELEYAGNVLG